MNVVFDLGGVVIAWQPAAIAASVFAAPADQALVLERVVGHPDWVELDRGTLPLADAIARGVARTGFEPRRLEAFYAAVPPSLVPMPESVALLDAVRGAGRRLLALSNLQRASFAYLDRTYDLFRRFDGWVVSCEVGACKPEPAIYRHLLDRHALDPRDTLFIDDVQANLDAAAAFGIRTIRFEDAASCRAALRAAGCL
jgi:putative hydrolase of the HAD superfamily